MFVSLAEWAAKQVSSDLPMSQERAWKPNLLVPVEDPGELRGTFRLIHNITYPKGSVKLAGLALGTEDDIRLSNRLPIMSRAFREDGVFASWTIIEGEQFGSALLAGMQALSGSFFRPNIVFLTMPSAENRKRIEALQQVIQRARQHRLGIALLAPHAKARFGRKQTINVWIRERSPDWSLSMRLGNLDLALLMGYKLKRNWRGEMRLLSAVEAEDQIEPAEEFLNNVAELARFPDAEVHVLNTSFKQSLVDAPLSDVNIFGLSREPDFAFLRETVDLSRTTCIFVRDSGEENVLA
jgi:hypothetical protein